MSWFNMGGLNPNFKEFTDKHPEKTLIGMWWSLYWRPAVIFLALELVVLMIAFIFGFAFGSADHGHDDWGRGPGAAMPAQGKLNINIVCQSALAYTTFPDASSSEAFVTNCEAGKHPEVIERYKADMGLGAGAAI